MIKKTYTFKDYFGNERTMDFLFDISEAELMDMQFTTPGGFREYLQKITQEKDQIKLITEFKKIIHMSYGELDPDGIHFAKSEDITRRFTQTPAYSMLYTELASDEKAAADFVKGILPKFQNKQAISAPPLTPVH